MIAQDPMFITQTGKLAELAVRYAIIYATPRLRRGWRLDELWRQVGIYVGRLLKREKPADLPVIQASKFDLIINLKTAKTIGITLSPDMLSIADEMIE
jgi:putative ABC transport system substrate-binding protein